MLAEGEMFTNNHAKASKLNEFKIDSVTTTVEILAVISTLEKRYVCGLQF